MQPPPAPPNTQFQPADTPSSSFVTSDAQFDDLHSRLQIIAASVDSLSRELTKLADNSEGRHRELMRNTMASSGDQLNAMDQRVQSIERSVRDYDGKLSNIQTLLKDSHSSLIEGLPAHMTNSNPLFAWLLGRMLTFTQSYPLNRLEWVSSSLYLSYFSFFSRDHTLCISVAERTDLRSTCRISQWMG